MKRGKKMLKNEWKRNFTKKAAAFLLSHSRYTEIWHTLHSASGRRKCMESNAQVENRYTENLLTVVTLSFRVLSHAIVSIIRQSSYTSFFWWCAVKSHTEKVSGIFLLFCYRFVFFFSSSENRGLNSTKWIEMRRHNKFMRLWINNRLW